MLSTRHPLKETMSIRMAHRKPCKGLPLLTVGRDDRRLVRFSAQPRQEFWNPSSGTEYAAPKAQGKLNLPSWTWALHKAVSHGYRTAEKPSLDVPRKRCLFVLLIHKGCSRSDDPLMLTRNHRQRRGFTSWDLDRNWTWGQNHCLIIH